MSYECDDLDMIDRQNKKAAKAANGPTNGEVFMKFKEKNRFRLVGKMKAIFTLYYNQKRYQVPDDQYYFDKCAELLGDKAPIKSAVVANVIDRDDEASRKKEGLCPRIKIIEKGPSIFDSILAYTKENLDENGKKIHPGGQDGIDWIVNAKIPADPAKRRNTKYEIVPSRPTPFTKEEKELFARTENVELIKMLFSTADFDKIVSLKYFEKFKTLPLGEKGLVDLNSFCNEERAKVKLDELFAQLSGEPASPVESKTVAPPKKNVEEEEDFGMDLGGEEQEKPSDEKEESSEADSSSSSIDALF